MPSRMIRGDDLLESERYMALPDEQKVFYNHVLYASDDFGLLSLAPLRVRKLFHRAPTQERVMKLARALEEVDMVRIYEVDEVFYLFVPRFSQRLKSFRSKCPMPQPHIYADDAHAAENFNKYRSQFKKLATTSGGQATTRRLPLPEVEVKRSEEKRSGSEGASITVSGAEADLAVDATHPVEKESNGNGHVNGKTLHERAELLGLIQGENEPRNLFMLRVASAEAKARQGAFSQ